MSDRRGAARRILLSGCIGRAARNFARETIGADATDGAAPPGDAAYVRRIAACASPGGAGIDTSGSAAA